MNPDTFPTILSVFEFFSFFNMESRHLSDKIVGITNIQSDWQLVDLASFSNMELLSNHGI